MTTEVNRAEQAAGTANGPSVANAAATPESGEGMVPSQLSPEQIDELRAKAAKAEENWDRLVRLTADLENYKKRAARERQDAVKYANESLVEKLIPVLDNFDMALMAAGNPQAGTVDSLKKGVEMIAGQLRNALVEAGLEEIDASKKPFDPNFHEAVSEQESTEAPEGQVLQQLRKGYKLRDRLIRPATVVVAKKPSA